MRVLVTRALEEARRTADELASRGHEAVAAPMSEIRPLETEDADLANVQAILATSSNGVRAFAGRCARRDIRLLTVGENTAATARLAGFADVSSADGDSAALVALVRHALNPVAGALLHATGKSRANGLHLELAKAGFECRVWELYEVVASRSLPKQVIEAFGQGAIDATLVLSPQSGRILVEALRTDGVAAKCGRIIACCISEAAAAKIRDIEFGSIRIAERPTLDAVLALLDSEPGGATAIRA